MSQKKTLNYLKTGKMYLLPKTSKYRAVVSNPSVMCVDVLGYVKPLMPFVFIERKDNFCWAKVLTHEGIVGWVQFDLFLDNQIFVEVSS